MTISDGGRCSGGARLRAGSRKQGAEGEHRESTGHVEDRGEAAESYNRHKRAGQAPLVRGRLTSLSAGALCPPCPPWLHRPKKLRGTRGSRGRRGRRGRAPAMEQPGGMEENRCGGNSRSCRCPMSRKHNMKHSRSGASGGFSEQRG